MTTDRAIAILEKAAREIREKDIPGWGNAIDCGIDALRTALAQLDEARAERERTKLHMSAWEDSARINKHRAEEAENEITRHRHYNFDWKARAEAAEARLEELTRERDEARAHDNLITEKLQALGEKYGCPAGMRRLVWLETQLARLEEAKAVLGKLLSRAENFWALLQGEHGVRLTSADEDDHNVYGFFQAADEARAFLYQGGSDAR